MPKQPKDIMAEEEPSRETKTRTRDDLKEKRKKKEGVEVV